MPEKSVCTESLSRPRVQHYEGARLRVGLIGCGGISETHLKILAAMPQVQVVAATDKRGERLEAVKEKWGVRRCYTDWKQMLREGDLDAVDICTPNWLHSAAAIDAANAGCHVMVEKPMAITPEECAAMIHASHGAGKKLSIGFQYRFHPNTQFLTRARERGRFGKILFVRCQAMRRRGIPNWGVFGQKHLQGGGPMIDIGVHVLEMAHYVMGSPRPVAADGNAWTYLGNKPSEVISPWPNWDHQTYTVEDYAAGQIRFETGAILQIETMFAGHIKEDVWNFTLVGEEGGCSWDPPMIFGDCDNTMMNQNPSFVGKESDFDSLFSAKLQNWVDACLTNSALKAPGEAGLAVQKMIDGVYRSATAGQQVAI